MLRNYLRLYARTGYQGFYDQAKVWRDFFVNTYSFNKGGKNNMRGFKSRSAEGAKVSYDAERGPQGPSREGRSDDLGNE